MVAINEVLLRLSDTDSSLQKDIPGFQFGLFTGNGAAVGWDADSAHLVDEGGTGDGA